MTDHRRNHDPDREDPGRDDPDSAAPDTGVHWHLNEAPRLDIDRGVFRLTLRSGARELFAYMRGDDLLVLSGAAAQMRARLLADAAAAEERDKGRGVPH